MPLKALSLRKRLMLWLLPPLLLLSVAWAWGVYAVILHFANIAYDRSLEDSAQTLAGQISVRDDGVDVDLPHAARAMLEFDQIDTIYYSVSDQRGARLTGNATIPRAVEPGLCITQTCFYNTSLNGKSVRVAQYSLATGNLSAPLIVRVAETMHKREMLAREVLAFVLMPQGLFVTGIVALIWFGIGRGMRPLRRIRDAVSRRTFDDLSHIEIADMPAELQEHTAVINDLMSRLRQAIDMKKRFIADATHQLRTPITVLRTQAELAMRIRDHDELKASVVWFDAATTRLVRLANQLLSLSLAESRAIGPRQFEVLDFVELAEDVIAELVPLALQKNLEVAVESTSASLQVMGHSQFLKEMMANLIDNAVRYTKPGGKIDISIAGASGCVTFTVADNGPGIPAEERAHVLLPFYRSADAPGGGCGLGLTIASEIAAMHGGDVTISDARTCGTTVIVSFPCMTAALPANPYANRRGPERPNRYDIS